MNKVISISNLSVSFKNKKIINNVNMDIIKGKTKANRFIEKNLVRKFIVFWDVFSEKKFLSQQKELNYDTCDCFLECAKKISESYPEIEWFKDCEIDFTHSLFENI